ncbi:MAG: DUF2116 family Zn-ribbon domain-containing protein [Lachnospiraceae bacterium]|nr:DUF2116 family Zn-ribbon domain-containing protein [Lachnospiraceae bacterium]
MNERENNDILEEGTEDVGVTEITETPMNEEVPVDINGQAETSVFCVKCGANIENGQQFCPSCGHKVGDKLEKEKKKGVLKKTISVIGAVAVIAVIAVVAFVLIRGKQAKEITLNKSSITLKVDESVDLSFVISPEDTKDKTVSWSTSNDVVATVNDGKITGKGEGDCIITVSTKNGKTDTCDITVEKAGPDLKALYDEYCNSDFARIADDGSYLFVDTNTSDKDDEIDYVAYLAILEINEALALPESVNNKMNQTRSMDGIQTESGEGFEVSWTYHPEKGLEVTYSLTK